MSGSGPDRKAKGAAVSAERPSGAGLVVRQPAGGYRFSIDAFLLADFAAPFCGRSVLDLGTGSGVVLLLLAAWCPGLDRGVGLEIQRELWEFARDNIGANGLAARLEAFRGDLRDPPPGVPPGAFDLVVSNPPFRPVGRSRRSPLPGKEIARHEVACTLADVVRAAARGLGPGGRFATIALPSRLPELLSLAAREGIAAERVRFVHAFPGRPAHRLLFAGSRPGTSLSVAPPLFVHAGPGRYSPEVEGILRRNSAAR